MFTVAALAIAIRLVHADRVPEGVLRRAEEVAAGIFADAGVRVVWRDCRVETCTEGSGLWVQFVEQRRGAPGYAVIGSYAAIRYPVVEAAAQELEVDAAAMLGASIAHEAGHLLLGKGHAPRGVMRRHLGRAEVEGAARGELRFSGPEAEMLRRRLQRGAAR